MESAVVAAVPPPPPPDQDYRALRISQLDASELDSEIFDLMLGQVKNVLKYIKPGLLTMLGPELNASLRYVLWAFSLRTTQATVGQGLLQLRYKDITLPGTQWMNKKQKILFAMCQIVGPWLQERAADLAILTRHYPGMTVLWTLLGKSEKFWKVAALMNFLVFLQNGNYQFLMERLVGVRAVFPRRMGARQVSFEYMDREMLWHGFAEFLFFVLPLINFRKLKNYITRMLLPRSQLGGGMIECLECAICGEWPVNVHEMGCVHVFCYTCLMGNMLADSAFSCSLCGQPVGSMDVVRPVIVNRQGQNEHKETYL